MNLSYWEYNTWLSNVDFTIIGSGIVGLSCALYLSHKHPKAKILILEKGNLPQGASTKNAGFACFGSISEVLSDLKQHSEEEVIQLVQKRWEGIQLLRKTLGDKAIDFQQHGGYEVFLQEQGALYENCLQQIDEVNTLLTPVFGQEVFKECPNSFGFNGVANHYISHVLEGQLHPGKMMQTLIEKVQQSGVLILNSSTVTEYVDHGDQVVVQTDQFEFKTNKLLIATNGFASQFLEEDVQPARAQVLITSPIAGLRLKGAFHLDEGYYYFRNIGNQVLFGGGRNLDFKTEETVVFGQTSLVQNRLETLLSEVILPNTPFQIDRRWSGIMGVGAQKKPIIKQLSNNVGCGVRLGGMGIAIGSLVGKELADIF